jgi:hypothetical protein
VSTGDYARDFHDGLAAVEIGDKWGYIDRTGKMVIDPQPGFGYRFSEGLARAYVAEQKKFGFIDKTGKMVIAPQFSYAFEFIDQLAYVAPKWDWGFINSAGAIVIPFKFEDEDRFSEGVAAVGMLTHKDAANGQPYELYDHWGYIDRTGNYVIAPRFSSADPFSEYFASVIEGKRGYIDHSGKMVIAMPSNYDYEILGYFHDGRVLVDRAAEVQRSNKASLTAAIIWLRFSGEASSHSKVELVP